MLNSKKLTKPYRQFVSLIFISILVIPSVASAMMIGGGDNDDPNCAKILVVFARGSGQNNTDSYADISHPEDNDLFSEAGVNKDEKQTAKFFEEFHARIPRSVKYVSLHNETSSTGQTYNQYGYAAVTAFDAIDGPFNTLTKPPLHRKDVSNRYYESVKDGAEELAWYLEDQMTSCPMQQVILGGYSQGAEVVADGINIMQPAFRARVADVALYGDPKFNPREDGSYVKGPWVRGDATLPNLSGGVLSPRKQYVPNGVANLGSWCADGDKICDAGFRDSRTILKSAVDPLHKNSPLENTTHSNAYQDTWIAQSMNEIVRLVRNRVPNTSVGTNVYINKNDKLWNLDLAIVIDDSSSMSDVLQTVKGNAGGLSGELLDSYWQSRVGLVTYNGTPTPDPTHQYSSVVTPLTSDDAEVRQGLQSLQPEEPYYSPTGNGDYYLLPEQSAQLDGVMTAIKGLSWEHGAQKKVIVITNNPAAAQDPSPNHWTTDQVKQAAFNLDPAGLNLANASCIQHWYGWGCNNAIDSQFQDLADSSGGQIGDINISYGTIDDLTNLLQQINTQPVASFTGDQNGYLSYPLSFNAISSYDPNTAITEYDWDCNSDGIWDSVTFFNPNGSCTYDAPYDGLVTMRSFASEDWQSTYAVLPVHVSEGFPPASPTTPEAPDTTLTYSDTNMRLSWTNTYSSDVYIRVSDDQDNLIGYAPADAPYVTLAGIGSDIPELNVSACTDAAGCSDPTILSLDHDKLEAMIMLDDNANTFVVPETVVAPSDTDSSTPNSTEPIPQNEPSKSENTQSTSMTPIVPPATFTDFLTPTSSTSVLGDTAPLNVAKQFNKHAITATSTTELSIKKRGLLSLWFTFVLSGLGVTLLVYLLIRTKAAN